MCREDEASGEEKARLGALGGQLMAAREGLAPLDQAALDAELAEAAAQLGNGQAAGSPTRGVNGTGADGDGRGDTPEGGLARKGAAGLSAEEAAEIGRRRAGLAFSREASLSAEKQVSTYMAGISLS